MAYGVKVQCRKEVRIAQMIAASLPASSPIPAAGAKACFKGSTLPQYTIPVPIPAQREIAHQFQVLNVGFASGPPNLTFPKG